MKFSKGFTLMELMVVIFIALMLLGVGGAVIYPMSNRQEATGIISGIATMTPNITIRDNQISNTCYSFAVDITTEDREIISFSSEDRKFTTCEKGQKVKVAYSKYPPWHFEKAGTFYRGRLLKKYAQQ